MDVALLCRRRRGRHARGAPSRRGRDSPSPKRAPRSINKSSARPRRCSRRCRPTARQRPRLHVQPHPVAAPLRQDRRSRTLMLAAPREPERLGRSRSMVGRAAADRAQAARSRRAQSRLRGRQRRRDADERELSRRAAFHRRAGSRCASCASPAAALAHFARIADGVTNPITLARSYYWQGRAAEALGRGAGRARPLRSGGALSHRLLRPARAGATRHRRDRAARAAGAARRSTRRLEVARAFEILYADRRARPRRHDGGRSRRQDDGRRRAGDARARSPRATTTRARRS